MSKQYWIGGFYIDLSRNQITQNKKTLTLPPKALAVLTCLAENYGQVISQDDLLSQVWPDTIVSPNTLQRSIAQLRKALGDDGKGQNYIKTHAKQGYSLECDVRWQANNDATNLNTSLTDSSVDEPKYTNNSSQTPYNPQLVSGKLKSVYVIVGVILLAVFFGRYFFKQPVSTLSFDSLRLLTATDDKEFDATYSPDGQYIVFHRYLAKQCVNRVWAKDIATQKETLLTKNWGAYGSHDFSPDGKQLVFLATEACDEPVTQKRCYDLVSLDFSQALERPQQPSVILQCENSTVRKPKWISDNNIALLQKNLNRWKLINYSIKDHSSTDFYVPINGDLIDYTYSVSHDLLAVSSLHKDGQQYLEVFSPNGQMLSSHPIKRPPEIPEHRPIYPNFHPENEQLIFSTGRQLFSLSFTGQIDKINLPFADKMAQPEFHPGGHKLLMLKGPYDSDVVILPLNLESINDPSNLEIDESLEVYASFQRTNVGEDYAVFQPNGQLIAFWSERSGEEQLWISDGQDSQQLTNFPMDTYIRGIDWAADGQSILVNANNILTQVYLDKKQQLHSTEHPVIRLYQWNSNNNNALLLMRIEGVLKFVEHDFNLGESKELASEKTVLWGLKSESGQLIYKDHLGQFWQPGPIEATHLEALNMHSGEAKSFVINNNILYDINKKNQLWSYDLATGAFKVLRTLRDDVDYLTDVNQSRLLMTVQVAAKKEVVELTVSE